MLGKAVRLDRLPAGNRAVISGHVRFSTNTVAIEKGYDLIELAGRNTDRSIRRPIIEPYSLAIVVEDPAAGKHDIGHIADALIIRFRAEDPFIAAYQQPAWIIPIEHRETEPVNGPR